MKIAEREEGKVFDFEPQLKQSGDGIMLSEDPEWIEKGGKISKSEGKAFAKKAGRETILGGEFFRSAKTKIAGWGAYARVRKKKKWN